MDVVSSRTRREREEGIRRSRDDLRRDCLRLELSTVDDREGREERSVVAWISRRRGFQYVR